MTVGSDTNLAQEQYGREEDRRIVEQTAKGLAAIFAFVNYLGKKIEQDVTNAAQQSLEEKLTGLVSKEASSSSLKSIFSELKTEAKWNLLDDSLKEVSIVYSGRRELTVELNNPYYVDYKSEVPIGVGIVAKNLVIVHRTLVSMGYNYDMTDMCSVQDGWVTKKVGDGRVTILSEDAGYSFKFSFDPSKPASLTEVARILCGSLCNVPLTDRIVLVGSIYDGEKPSQKSSEYFNKAVDDFNKTSEVHLELKFEGP